MTSMLYGKRRELSDGSVDHRREFVTRSEASQSALMSLMLRLQRLLFPSYQA
jgi:hypothetical protein